MSQKFVLSISLRLWKSGQQSVKEGTTASFISFIFFYLYFRQGSIFGHVSVSSFLEGGKKDQFRLFLVVNLHRSYKRLKI